jgi:hypothetical protein
LKPINARSCESECMPKSTLSLMRKNEKDLEAAQKL